VEYGDCVSVFKYFSFSLISFSRDFRYVIGNARIGGIKYAGKLLKFTVNTLTYKAGFPLGGIFLCLVISRVELIRKDNEIFAKFCLVETSLI
jgi:hypothetical protein